MSGLTAKQEKRCREVAGAERCPVVVVEGDSPPHTTGERGHAEFKNGGPCRNYYSARRAGYKVKYIRSDFQVEVGEDWLEMDALVTEARKKFHGRYLGLAARWLEETGTDPALAGAKLLWEETREEEAAILQRSVWQAEHRREKYRQEVVRSQAKAALTRMHGNVAVAADWLEDAGCEEAAALLRQGRLQESV